MLHSSTFCNTVLLHMLKHDFKLHDFCSFTHFNAQLSQNSHPSEVWAYWGALVDLFCCDLSLF